MELFAAQGRRQRRLERVKHTIAACRPTARPLCWLLTSQMLLNGLSPVPLPLLPVRRLSPTCTHQHTRSTHNTVNLSIAQIAQVGSLCSDQGSYPHTARA